MVLFHKGKRICAIIESMYLKVESIEFSKTRQNENRLIHREKNFI